MIGTVSNSLTVVRWGGRNRKHESLWVCRCVCGAFVTIRQSLITGRGYRQKSCGCVFRAESSFRMKRRPANFRHGMKSTVEYETWTRMRGRCRNPRSPDFSDYGGRGIQVSPAWETFEAFYRDMGPRPSTAHSLDRIDVDGNYEPGNCRWATKTEQAINRRNVIMVEIDGQKRCLKEWSTHYGLTYRTVHLRVQRYGWDPVRALTTPFRPLRRNHAPRI